MAKLGLPSFFRLFSFFFSPRIHFVQIKAENSADAGIYVVHMEKISDIFPQEGK